MRQDLEEDKDLRSTVNIYKDPSYKHTVEAEQGSDDVRFFLLEVFVQSDSDVLLLYLVRHVLNLTCI